MNIARVEELARAMRSAIEGLRPIRLPGGLGEFPDGNCAPASLLLGAVFADDGIAGFKSVWGARNPEQRVTHVWLASESLTVDITADQFKDGQPRVLVTAHSDWHQSFAIKTIDPSDFRDPSFYGFLPITELSHMYEKIRAILKARSNERDA